jgi:hypothetical protein
MSRLIPAAERIVQARKIIQKARDYPVPAEAGRYDISYVANIKSLLQKARDLVKFIPYSVTATPELKQEVAQIFAECDLVDRELLRGT